MHLKQRVYTGTVLNSSCSLVACRVQCCACTQVHATAGPNIVMFNLHYLSSTAYLEPYAGQHYPQGSTRITATGTLRQCSTGRVCPWRVGKTTVATAIVSNLPAGCACRGLHPDVGREAGPTALMHLQIITLWDLCDIQQPIICSAATGKGRLEWGPYRALVCCFALNNIWTAPVLPIRPGS